MYHSVKLNCRAYQGNSYPQGRAASQLAYCSRTPARSPAGGLWH